MEELPFDARRLRQICRHNDIARLSVFGSVARGDATEHSDVDLLVRFSKPKSLLELVRLEREVSAALGRRVDLLTEASISPYMRDKVKREMRTIYGA